MQFKKILSLFFVCCLLSSFSQIKIGSWVDHLSYTSANSITKVGSVVYASNGSGLVKYNTGDASLEKLTKVEGLSDVGVQLLRKNDYNSVLLVVYSNTNIDVIRPDGTILNISDIKRKIIPGKKYINEVYFKDRYAYISCGFGIVVFDTEGLEIKDTYYIGNGVTNKEIYQVTSNDTAFFAATESGIYYANKMNNLTNFQSWKTLNAGIPAGPYNGIAILNGNIITNYSAMLRYGQLNKDTLYQYNGTNWSKYTAKPYPYTIKRMFDYSK